MVPIIAGLTTAGLAFLVGNSALAQLPGATSPTSAVMAMTSPPRPARCTDFQAEGPEQWRIGVPISINGGLITLGVGTVVSAGASFGGIDIGRTLNERCRGRSEQLILQ